MERQRSMKMEKARYGQCPVAAADGVPLILEYVSLREGQNQAPKHFVSEGISSSERCTS
jgi:hypothetical protein